MKTDTSERLRELLRAGRPEAATELLHDAHAADLLRYVRFLGARDAEGVCQEAWFAVSRALPGFRFEATPRVWLFGIARSKLVDERRRQVRRRSSPLGASLDSFESLVPAAGTRRPSTPESKLIRQRRAAALERVLGELEPVERELVELRFVSGLKPAEIVTVLALDVLPNTLSQRLLRLVNRLRERLSQCPEFAPP